MMVAQLNNDSNVTVIGAYAAAIIRAVEARGVSVETVLRAVDLETLPGNDPAQRLPLASIRKLFDVAVELTDDPYFGLYAAKFLHPAHFHALGIALLASSSLRDAGTRLARYFRLLSGSTRATFSESGGVGRLEFPIVVEPPPLTDDMVSLFLLRLFAELSDGAVRPVSVALHRPTPPDGGIRHCRMFGCPVSFGAPHTIYSFPGAALDLPWSGASRELVEQNEQIVISYLAKLDRCDIQTRVRALLLEDLPSGTVTKENVAKKLCMSARTLQIKLAQSSTTFQDIVNETRCAVACGYLENSTLSITEVAFLLGFSDTSNFSRAFRRWMGRSPRAYLLQRRQHPRHGNGSPTPKGKARTG
jgi:AraC-like DNA-binding protein